MSLHNLRTCLRLIRDPATFPSMTLPSGMTASETAHKHVLAGNVRRNQKEKKPCSKSKNKCKKKGDTYKRCRYKHMCYW